MDPRIGSEVSKTRHFFLTIQDERATAQNCIWEHKTDPVDAISWLVVSFGPMAGRPGNFH